MWTNHLDQGFWDEDAVEEVLVIHVGGACWQS